MANIRNPSSFSKYKKVYDISILPIYTEKQMLLIQLYRSMSEECSCFLFLLIPSTSTYGSCSPFSMGEFKTAKRLGMLAKRMSIISSYLWIQPFMFNCLASRLSRPANENGLKWIGNFQFIRIQSSKLTYLKVSASRMKNDFVHVAPSTGLTVCHSVTPIINDILDYLGANFTQNSRLGRLAISATSVILSLLFIRTGAHSVHIIRYSNLNVKEASDDTRCREKISFICTWARRQYTSVEVGTARRIGKALTNNLPYLVGVCDRWLLTTLAWSYIPALAGTYCEERRTRETKRPWWLAPGR
ncbi:hypothetical protein G5I_04799 [Acromyrmex echinatior]|uniref:Uncharacterized protein n=1 Tax=Acromyrmex echinatior TaxID=103372 RepID=F4WGL7_ACREC|nr:hypothetical protein G5I_04799 [Acromyrmex echinatior]